jgi:hypothetical protein
MLKKNSKTQSKDEPTEVEDNQLYYHHMGGQGIISCYDCGYKEDWRFRTIPTQI